MLIDLEIIAQIAVSAGFHPELLFAGAAGGWLAHTYQGPAEFKSRISRILFSALVASWFTPVTVHLMNLPADPVLAKFPLAFAFGLLTVDVLGHGIISMARKWFKEKSDGK